MCTDKVAFYCGRYCGTLDEENLKSQGVLGTVHQYVVDAGNRIPTHTEAIHADDIGKTKKLKKVDYCE